MVFRGISPNARNRKTLVNRRFWDFMIRRETKGSSSSSSTLQANKQLIFQLLILFLSHNGTIRFTIYFLLSQAVKSSDYQQV